MMEFLQLSSHSIVILFELIFWLWHQSIMLFTNFQVFLRSVAQLPQPPVCLPYHQMHRVVHHLALSRLHRLPLR